MSNESSASHHPLSSLYRRSVLDPLIEIARMVAHDSVKRPRFYRDISSHIATILEGFRIRTGSAPEWMSASQRSIVCCGFFGEEFSAAAIVLRTAAVSFAEQAGEDNRELLMQTFLDSARAFRSYLRSIEGSTVAVADRQIGEVFNSAIEVLRNAEIARIFGMGSAGSDLTDADGSDLIHEIQRRLTLDYLRPALSRHRLALLQRAAHYGAATIAGVLGDDTLDENRARALLQNAYGWEKALQQLLFTVDTVRAWKDPKYREGLTACERNMLAPHPSGEISLKSTELDAAQARTAIGLGFSTWTLIAICCSTGDLPCTQASEGSWYCCPTAVGFTCPATDCPGCTIV